MPKKKAAKKTVYKKASTRSLNGGKNSRTVSFVIGVVTVIILGLLVFAYSRMNNYTQVLGSQASQETILTEPAR